MKLALVIAVVAMAGSTVVSTPNAASAATCRSAGKVVAGGVVAGSTCRATPRRSSGNNAGRSRTDDGESGGGGILATPVIQLTPVQRAFNDAATTACLAVTTAGGTCPQPDPQQPVQAVAAAPAPLPRLTPGIVSSAFQKIPVPQERSITQPGTKTLVNFDTIFYTQAEGFRRDLTLVGQQVTLDISPVQYTWHHGDGTTSVTDSPGGPYPDKSVTYRYANAHVTVSHHVSVTWGARFRVNGGPWNDVPGTVTSVGPSTDLRIAEATPVLSGVADQR